MQEEDMSEEALGCMLWGVVYMRVMSASVPNVPALTHHI
jgi:hypothetical protein